MFSQALAHLAPRLLGLTIALAAFAVNATMASAGILDASWTAPTTNVDSSPLTDLGSYRLYYATSAAPCPGASYVAVASPTASPGAGETIAVRLTGLAAGTPYHTAVTAVDTSGNESACLTATQAAVARIDFAVSPTTTTSFGSVLVGGVVDRTFTVQNTAGGTISGTVVTSAPFSVVSGSAFNLVGVGATHVATIRFRPTVAATATTNVNFTTASGDTVSRVVTGIGTAAPTTPTIAITGPTSAATYSTSSLSIALSGTATSASQVTWANSRGGGGTATGTTTWTAAGIVLLAGTNVLTVTARDSAGNTATDTLTVTVTVPPEPTPPTVSLTAPAPGSTVSGTITVSASASDDVGVAGVQFKLDGVNLGAEDTAAPYTVSWNTTTAAAGVHSLTAVARDAAGNTTTSTAVTVTVGSVPAAVLLANGSFESFTGAVAAGWTLVTDGVVGVTMAKVTGLTGFGQRITVSTPGTWGFALQQKPTFRLNQTYEWTLSYKTSGTNSVWAQVIDSTGARVVLSQQLAGTSGAWRQRTFTFTYTDARAKLLRISSNAVGAIWLDAFSLREVDAPLLANGSFESFTGHMATGWQVTTDGVVAATVARGAGLTGLGQKIAITTPGTWGLYFHQELVLKLDAAYEWTFSYKTSGTNAVWAQVSDAAFNHVVLTHELPGTNGAWKQQTLTFTYTNTRANLLRMSSNDVGSVWLDAFSLREVDAPIVSNGNFEFFTGNVATGWKVATDGVVGATVAKALGHSGSGQRINITTPGVWGLYLHQQLVLKVDADYEWTFWYKTSGANTVWAQVSDSAMNDVVLSRQLPGTNGVWRQQTLTFTYTNAQADLLRITSNAVGSVWLDEFSVHETAP